MRPIADTAVASIVNMPALDCRSWPQCTVCQSVAHPSMAEYWHIGDTTMRLARLSLRSLKGENSVLDTVMTGTVGDDRGHCGGQALHGIATAGGRVFLRSIEWAALDLKLKLRRLGQQCQQKGYSKQGTSTPWALLK